MSQRTLLAMYLAIALCGCEPPDEDPIVVVEVDLGQVAADAATSDQGTLRDLGATRDTASDADPVVEVPPLPPPTLEHWVTGADGDAEVTPGGPGFILMGGGPEPDAAFQWWGGLLNGGDVVVLRVTGSDGYNDYLFSDIGGVDSVETLKVTTRELADDPYIAWRIDHAEGVFLAGGDQWDYLSIWSGTGLQDALRRVAERGGVIGGTSAGLAVLGDRAFSAENDSVYSEEALADPYNEFMRFDDEFLSLGPLAEAVTDSHFRERDRMGRLVTFVARMWTDGFAAPVGIGVDEATALLIGPDGRRVVGAGSVYVVSGAAPPAVCVAGEALEWAQVSVERTSASDSRTYSISASGGALLPADVY